LYGRELLSGCRWLLIALFLLYAAKRRSLTALTLVGIVAGAEVGHDWPKVAIAFQVFASIFLRLIKAIIAPLLFGTLVVGIAGHADVKKVGRMGVKALIYFEIVSTLAMIMGLVAINVSRAGVGVHFPSAVSKEISSPRLRSPGELLVDIFPENIAKSIAEDQILQVVVFSILFGVALALVPETKRGPMLAFAESLTETMMKFTNLIMLLAPVAVFGAMAYTVGSMGTSVVIPLTRLLATMYVTLIGFTAIVLLPIAILVGVPVRRFVAAVAEPVSIAFATASSEAALPRAIEQMEKLGVARETVAFVLPTGYSFNLDGSSVYQALALVFVAQAAGIHLSIGQQTLMFLTLLASSKGTAGVARASLVVVLGVAPSFGLPSGPILLLFGIDQLMDMGRTAINVLGNCLATMVIARWEGETVPFLAELPES
jgi:proton glutamate symport protein